ncbi:hypothetical protein Tco_0571325 [Tanacetum coccineum]
MAKMKRSQWKARIALGKLHSSDLYRVCYYKVYAISESVGSTARFSIFLDFSPVDNTFHHHFLEYFQVIGIFIRTKLSAILAVLATRSACRPSLASCLSSYGDSLPSVPDAYGQSLEALLSQPAASESETKRTIQVLEYTMAATNVIFKLLLVKPKKECHVGLKKAQGEGYFALILLSKEAQAGNPCELLFNPTTKIRHPMIEGMKGRD